MFVKLCGLTTRRDVAAAVEAGADAIGFVLSLSRRQVSVKSAASMAREVPGGVLTVAVVAGLPGAEAGALAVRAQLQAVQLHGPYPKRDFGELNSFPVVAVRATTLGHLRGRPYAVGSYHEDLLLLDSSEPGSGRRWDLCGLQGMRPEGRWAIAGGLDPSNVAGAIGIAQPWGVDVSSGVESSPGVKDRQKMIDFVAAAREASGGRYKQPFSFSVPAATQPGSDAPYKLEAGS